MSQKPPKGRPLLILGTTSERSVLQQLQLRFNAEIAVPNLRTQEELAHVMQHSGQFTREDITRAVSEIRDYTGIQQVILAIQTARQEEDRAGRFVEVMGDVAHM